MLNVNAGDDLERKRMSLLYLSVACSFFCPGKSVSKQTRYTNKCFLSISISTCV